MCRFHFHLHTSKKFNKFLKHFAAYAILADAGAVLICRVVFTIDAPAVHAVEEFFHVTASFGSTCGALACIVSDGDEVLDAEK